MKDSEATPATVIGMGAMGSAIATVLLKGDHPTTVWNRSADRKLDVVDKGAVRASTLEEAFTASPLVIVCVLDQGAEDEILAFLDDGIIGGFTLVSLTSGSAERARKNAEWAAERRIDYLDGGILADPEDLGTANTSLMYSGSSRAYEVHGSTLGELGTTQYLGDDAGLASLYFMALVGIGYDTWIAFLDTLALVGADRVNASTIAPFVTGMFSEMTGLLAGMAEAADKADHPPAAGRLSVHAALMDDVIDTRERRGVNTQQLKRVKTLIDRRVADGHGDEGFSSLIDLLQMSDEVRGAESGLVQ